MDDPIPAASVAPLGPTGDLAVYATDAATVSQVRELERRYPTKADLASFGFIILGDEASLVVNYESRPATGQIDGLRLIFPPGIDLPAMLANLVATTYRDALRARLARDGVVLP